MGKELSTEISTVPPQVEVENVGLGTYRTAGTYIALLLQLERPGDRAGILMQVAKEMKIPLQELVDEYLQESCDKCGGLVMHHRQTGGQCP